MESGLQICSKCNIAKSFIDDFTIRNTKTGTRRKECKSCRSSYNKQLRLDNIEIYKEKDRIYHEENKEAANKRCLEYRKNNYEKVTQMEKDYYINNRIEILERKKVYHNINKDDPQYKIKRNLKENNIIVPFWFQNLLLSLIP